MTWFNFQHPPPLSSAAFPGSRPRWNFIRIYDCRKTDQQIPSAPVCSSLRSALHLENKKIMSDIKITCGPVPSPSSWCSIQSGHEGQLLGIFTQSQWIGNIWELIAGIRDPLQGQTPSRHWFYFIFICSTQNSTSLGSRRMPEHLLLLQHHFGILQTFP